MPPKPRQRRKQREVSAHMEHSQAESAVNAQNPPPPPPSDPNPEAPPTNLLLELIQSLQQNQSELAEAIKQLKEKDAGTKTPPQNEGGDQKKKKPHEDSGSHQKEATFVTMSDIADLLKQEREEHHWGVKKALPNDKGKIITFRIIVPILGAISSKNQQHQSHLYAYIKKSLWTSAMSL
jgi:hypothetical protein